MAISFSGLGTGLDTASWVEALVSIKQQKIATFQTDLASKQTVKNTLNDTRSAVSSLRTSIERLTDAKFGGTFDLFTLNTAKSSNEEVFTAVASTNARRQDYTVSVQQLASFTKAVSKDPASAVADDSTKLQNLGISKGTLTAYVNGYKNTINISEEDTLGDLKSRMAAVGVSVQVDESGVMKFTPQNDGDTIHIGTTTDTSNIVSILGLARQEDGSYESTNSVYKANVNTNLISEDSGFNQQITAGTFTLGNATFTIDENTTLSSLISRINNNEDSQANAYWDDTNGKLIITSTVEGASYINIEAGTSNFTDVMGLTNSAWDEEGNLLSSRMYTSAQELGNNAIFSINGTTMTSASNVISSDISRIEGVTITLNRVNTEEDGETTLKVSQNSSELIDAVKNFVSSYNGFISKIDKVTAQGADLHGETTLTSLKNTIRNFATGSNDTNGGDFKLLSEIGISVESASANNLSTETSALKFDEEKFMKALTDNPESVRALLTGDNSIMAMMEDTVEQSLKASVGYFDVKTSTIDSNIKKTNEKITRQSKSVSTYKAQLEKKFQAMEKMILSMQQNYNSFLAQ